MATNISEDGNNIGGFPYILDYLHIYMPYAVCSSILGVLGIAGNLFVIAAVLSHKKLRTNPTFILTANLALSDLAISMFAHPSIIAGVLLGKRFFDINKSSCVFLGSICLISCANSLITMGFIAFNRYICIFNNKKYPKYFSLRNTLMLCFISWTMSAIADLPNHLGIGQHVYDRKNLLCHFDRLRAVYTIPIIIICIIFPCICIFILYMRILCFTSFGEGLKRKKRLFKYKYIWKAIRIAKSTFLTFFFFFICWVPLGIMLIIDINDRLPIWAHTLGNLAGHLHSSLNPLIYLITNQPLREAYQRLSRVLTCNLFVAPRTSYQSRFTISTNNIETRMIII